MRPRTLAVISVVAFLTWGCTKEETPAVEAEQEDAATIAAESVEQVMAEAEPETAPADVLEDATAFQSMGYAMASQLRLNIGFSEEELAAIFAGMNLAATGAEQPEGFNESIQQAQQIYMQRMQAWQAQEQERAQALAEENKAKAEAFFATLDEKEGVQKSESGLYYEIIVEGEGDAPSANDQVKVNYKGVLVDGTEFDSGEGAQFMVSRVVPGFAEGLQLVKPGGKIKLYIPSSLGYGDGPARPGSPIGPGDALIFDVELLEVSAIPPPPSGPPPQLPANLRKPPPPPSGDRPSAPSEPPPAPPPAPPTEPPPGPPPSTIPPPPPTDG